MDVTCDRRDRALRTRTPFRVSPPVIARPIDDDVSRANNSFSSSPLPFRRFLPFVAFAGTLLEKGVARSGMIGQGNYKYYKLQLACVKAAQALTFTLTASNGNPDVYVSREPRPTTRARL